MQSQKRTTGLLEQFFYVGYLVGWVFGNFSVMSYFVIKV